MDDPTTSNDLNSQNDLNQGSLDLSNANLSGSLGGSLDDLSTSGVDSTLNNVSNENNGDNNLADIPAYDLNDLKDDDAAVVNIHTTDVPKPSDLNLVDDQVTSPVSDLDNDFNLNTLQNVADPVVDTMGEDKVGDTSSALNTSDDFNLGSANTDLHVDANQNDTSLPNYQVDPSMTPNPVQPVNVDNPIDFNNQGSSLDQTATPYMGQDMNQAPSPVRVDPMMNAAPSVNQVGSVPLQQAPQNQFNPDPGLNPGVVGADVAPGLNQAQAPVAPMQQMPAGSEDKDQNVYNFIIQIIQEKHGANMPADQLSAEADRLYDQLGDLLVNTFEPEMQDNQKTEFDDLVSQGYSQDDLQMYLLQNIPSLEQRIQQILIDFRQKYLAS